jgi:subtilisin family serine protease
MFGYDFEDKVSEGHITRASRSDSLTAQNDVAVGMSILGRPDGTPGSRPDFQQQPTELLVQFRRGVGADSQASVFASVGGGESRLLRSDENGDLLVLSLPAGGRALNAVMTALGNNPNVEFAEPNFLVSVQGSNDPRYTGGNLWGMYGDQTSPKNAFGSQAGEAWAAGHTGSMKTVIGVIDTGIDYRHPDLYLNIWLNPGEVPTNLSLIDFDEDGLITFRDLNQAVNAHAVSDLNGNGYIDAGDLLRDLRWANGVDNDGNGRIDDLIGWDFVNNDNDPMDGNGHGTHVAGTIGAMGNNGVGVVGVNWNVQLMALKFLPDSGSGTLSAAISAIDYYTAAAARYDAGAGNYVATNNSWGGGGYSKSLLDTIVRGATQDVLFVAAAGNGGSDGKGDNNDSTASYPSNYSTLSAAGWEAVVAVASITSSGALSSFSNFGLVSVDLGAPGSSILSTTPNGGYSTYSGTSMATPHVAGALGLLAGANEGLTGAELRDFLLSTTTATSSLANRTVTGGRLNVSDMLTAGGNPIVPPDDDVEDPVTDAPMLIYGTTGSDNLVGGSGNDVISGVPASGTHLGRGTIDTLTGGAGNDLFILGDARGRFYDDGNSRNAGNSDYALIKDFTQGDKIQLASGSYILRNASVNGVSGLGIYHDTNGNGRFDNRDELIGIIQGPYTPISDDFVFA